MQRIVITAALCGIVSIAGAENAGVKAVVERRQNMKRIERPVLSIKEGDAILSVFEDGSVKTQAVRLVKQPAAAVARVEALRDDQATLAAARALAKRVRQGHPKAASGLADAEVVAAADDVLDTSTKDKAAAGAIGAAVAAAVAALKKGKDKEGRVKA